MSTPNIKDILVEFEGENLSKYGLFPLFIWYLNDVIRLPEYFAQISVNRNMSSRTRGHVLAHAGNGSTAEEEGAENPNTQKTPIH